MPKENPQLQMQLRSLRAKPTIPRMKTMVIDCPHCGGPVGEESCVGCITATVSYVCSRCHKTFPNPKFRSNVQCTACGKCIFEEPVKSERHNIKLYVCQHCGHVENNPVFTNFHSCEGCKPPACKDCGQLLATNSLLPYWVCSGCGKQTPK